MFEQGGVSVIHSANRIVHRGGGLVPGDWFVGNRGATNCSTLCKNVMLAGGLNGVGFPNTYGGDPHFVKCLDALGAAPLNGVRVQYASMESTTGVDPQLPQMTPVTNVLACLRMRFSFQREPLCDCHFTDETALKCL